MGNRLRTLTNIGGGGYPGLIAGLTHAYKFEQYNAGGTILDRIGTDNLETIAHAPELLVSGKIGNCYDYNLGAVTNQYSYALNNLQIIDYGFTMKIWFYAYDITTSRVITDGNYNSTIYYGVNLIQTSGKLIIRYGNGLTTGVTSRRDYTTAVDCLNVGWNYICMAFPSYNNFNVNVNGVVQTMGYTSGTATSVNFVGCLWQIANTSTKLKLDEFYIWNRLLSTSEMQEIYTVENAGTSILP